MHKDLLQDILMSEHAFPLKWSLRISFQANIIQFHLSKFLVSCHFARDALFFKKKTEFLKKYNVSHQRQINRNHGSSRQW